MTQQVKKYEKMLNERKAYLESHMEKIEQQLEKTPNRDWDDNATEHEGDEPLEDLGNMELAELRGVDAALDRIKAGTYGICVICGEEITDARLDLLPQTPFCKKDAPKS